MLSLLCVHTLYNNTNINTKAHWQNSHSWMFIYPLQQHKQKTNRMLPKCPVLHVYIPCTKRQISTQHIIAKIPLLTYVHTLYNNTNKHTQSLVCHNSLSCICTYPLQKHKHKHKGSLKKMPILACVHTFYNNANKNTKLVAKIPRLPCAHTLHNNTNINIKARFQNSQSYMCTYPLQQ